MVNENIRLLKEAPKPSAEEIARAIVQGWNEDEWFFDQPDTLAAFLRKTYPQSVQ